MSEPLAHRKRYLLAETGKAMLKYVTDPMCQEIT